MKKLSLLFAALVMSTSALAQTPVKQSGASVTPNQVPWWVASGVIGGSVSSADSPVTSFGVTNNGGNGICVNSDRITAAGRNTLCMGTQTNGHSVLSVQNYGTATAQGLDVVINGATASFPSGGGNFILGTPPFNVTHVPCFSTTSGIVIDCGLAITPSGTISAGIWNGTAIDVAHGGTGATTAASARTNFGLGSMAVQDSTGVAITGGTITGMPTPASATDVAIKSYVDGLAAGISVLASSGLATAAVLPNTPTYSNGASGVGATLTAGSNTTLTVDGTAAPLNTVVLVKNQASAFQNGIYTVTAAGDGSNPWVLTRATYFDSAAEMVAGSYTLITSGSTNINTAYVLQSTVTTVGTTAAVFNLFSNFGISPASNSLPVFNVAGYANPAAAFSAAVGAGGGIVYFPKSVTISAAQVIGANITVLCGSTGVVISTSSTTQNLFTMSGTNSKIQNCGLQFNGTPGTKSAGYLVDVTGIYNTLDNLYIGPDCFVCININAAGDTSVSNILISGNTSVAPAGVGGGILCSAGSMHLSNMTMLASATNLQYYYAVKNLACAIDWVNSQVDTVNIGYWTETPTAGNSFSTITNVYLDFCFIYCVLIQPDASGTVGYTMLSNMELGSFAASGASVFIDATTGNINNTNITNVTSFNYVPNSSTGLQISGAVNNVLVSNSQFGDAGATFATGLSTAGGTTGALGIINNSFRGSFSSITLGGLLTGSQIMFNRLNGGGISAGGNSATNVANNLP